MLWTEKSTFENSTCQTQHGARQRSFGARGSRAQQWEWIEKTMCQSPAARKVDMSIYFALNKSVNCKQERGLWVCCLSPREPKSSTDSVHELPCARSRRADAGASRAVRNNASKYKILFALAASNKSGAAASKLTDLANFCFSNLRPGCAERGTQHALDQRRLRSALPGMRKHEQSSSPNCISESLWHFGRASILGGDAWGDNTFPVQKNGRQH